MQARRRMAGLALALAVGLGVTGCSLPDVGMSPSLTEAAATTSTTTATDDGATTRPSGELDTGSTTHTVAAGDRTLVVDWWTGEDATSWTADGAKTVQLAAHLEGGDTTTEVLVTRFLATADDGTTRTTVTEDAGEFVLTEPYSYSTALDVAPSNAGATQLTLTVRFELLVETEPGSGQYSRQTVLDTIDLPLLEETAP